MLLLGIFKWCNSWEELFDLPTSALPPTPLRLNIYGYLGMKIKLCALTELKF